MEYCLKLGQRRIILVFKYELDDKTVEVNVHAGLKASLTCKWIKFHVLSASSQSSIIRMGSCIRETDCKNI